jgi:hypothetical protein
VDPETSYPPEPWDLRGLGYISLWLVPAAVLPALPRGVVPLSLFGRAVVATAFVDYAPGGLLAYHELLVAPLVRRGARPGLSITDIWVDSAASLAGGRALWGIPKDMAEFELTHEPAFHGTATVDGTRVAEASVVRGRRGLRLPFPVRSTTFQTLDGALARTPLRSTGRLHLAKATWHVDGPLTWLRPYRPFLSVAAADFGLRFGPRHR